MSELHEAVKKSYMDFCCDEYSAGWNAHQSGRNVPSKSTQMFCDGWDDAQKAQKIISMRESDD